VPHPVRRLLAQGALPGVLAAWTILTCVAPAALAAQCDREQLSAELLTGGAWNVPTPLVVHHAGERSSFTAHYATRPFQDAPYYSYRVERTSVGRGVSLEMLHHKLYLANPRPPVDRLEISHGFNQVIMSVLAPARGWSWRFGIGVVVAHPEGEIGGVPVGPLRTFLGGGYHVAGVTTQVAVGRRYALGKGAVAMTVSPEARVTAALARVRTASGSLVVPNVALHGLGGAGVRRCW
jgi:hypothetical protein